MTDAAYIYDALRTPRGKNRGGALHSIKPVDLVVGLVRQIAPRNPGLELADIDDIVLGVVSPVGEQGGDLARTAALVAGLPHTVAGVQLNRFCASGLCPAAVASRVWFGCSGCTRR
jgi:acetyl-CoA C-acetyltransferase